MVGNPHDSFPLVVCRNLVSVSHHFRDITTSYMKIFSDHIGYIRKTRPAIKIFAWPDCYLFTVSNASVLFSRGQSPQRLLSICFPLVTLDFDLWPRSSNNFGVELNQHANYLGQRSFSFQFIVRTHAHTRDRCSTWTTKVVSKSRGHSLANWDSCPTPAESEAIEYLQVGPTEIRYSIAWTIFAYL